MNKRGRSARRPFRLALSSRPPKPRPVHHHPPWGSRRQRWPGPLGPAVTTIPASIDPHSSLVPSRTAAGTQGQSLSGKQGRPGPAQRRHSAFTENTCPVSAARPPAVNVSGCASNLLLEHGHAARGLRNDTTKEAPHFRARRSSRPFLCGIPAVTPTGAGMGAGMAEWAPEELSPLTGAAPTFPAIRLGPATPLPPPFPASFWVGWFSGLVTAQRLGTARVPRAGSSFTISPDSWAWEDA